MSERETAICSEEEVQPGMQPANVADGDEEMNGSVPLRPAPVSGAGQ